MNDCLVELQARLIVARAQWEVCDCHDTCMKLESEIASLEYHIAAYEEEIVIQEHIAMFEDDTKAELQAA